MSNQTKLLSAVPATTTIGTGEYLAKVDANGQVTRISLADLRAAVLGDLKSALGGTVVYNYANGVLVDLGIAAGGQTMLTISITGNSYHRDRRPIDTRVQFYVFTEPDGIIECSAMHVGFNFGGIKAFIYNGTAHIWFKQPASFMTFIVRAWASSRTNAPISVSATNAVMPTSGVTHEVTITPTTL